MKCITIRYTLASAILLSLGCSSGVAFAEQQPLTTAPSVSVTSTPDQTTKVPAVPVSATPAVATPAVSSVAPATQEKAVKTEKKKELTYTVSKSTLYTQLAYDFGKKGYKTVWDVRLNPSFKHYKYKSIQDEMVYAINRLNESSIGTYDDGNQVEGLICPENKEIHFVYSQYAGDVVDKDGQSCDMITPTVSNDSSSSNGLSSPQSTSGQVGQSNFYQTGNILSGPMIVGKSSSN